jgi:hypothetical protein
VQRAMGGGKQRSQKGRSREGPESLGKDADDRLPRPWWALVRRPYPAAADRFQPQKGRSRCAEERHGVVFRQGGTEAPFS